MNEPTVWEHVRVMQLEPNDVIVLNLPFEPTAAEADRLGATMRQLFPGHAVTILTGGSELTIARQEAIA